MSLLLTFEELVELTGYRMAGAQVADLQKQGFHRARRNAIGAVVLERDHYKAVCAGYDQLPHPPRPAMSAPRLREPPAVVKRGSKSE